jgi:hypothetical protein
MKYVFAIVFAGICMTGTAEALTKEKNEYLDVTEWVFKDELVKGDLVCPDEILVTSRPRSGDRSLIKVRRQFIPEMLKSVEHF